MTDDIERQMTDDGARSLSHAKDKAAQRHWGPKRGFFSATSFALTATSFALLFTATSFALTAFRPQLSDPAATQHSVFCDVLRFTLRLRAQGSAHTQ